jgi:phospholipid transport system substrate-binding protein
MDLKQILALFVGLHLVFAAVPSGAATGATEAVKAVLDRAMEIQTREDLAGDDQRQERARLIRALIADNFLSEEMGRESIKEHWDNLSPKQRSEFLSLFAVLFQDSYIRLVLNFLQKEAIEYRAESPDNKGKVVPTVILRANEHIPVDYHMLQKGGRWMIRDVDIDGVSIVENYRNTFRRVILSGSFDTLLQKMRLQSQATADRVGS